MSATSMQFDGDEYRFTGKETREQRYAREEAADMARRDARLLDTLAQLRQRDPAPTTTGRPKPSAPLAQRVEQGRRAIHASGRDPKAKQRAGEVYASLTSKRQARKAGFRFN